MALPPHAPPPMSTSSLPASARRIPLHVPPVRPPVLASDILREEIAPEAPARRAIRVALLAFGTISLVAAFGVSERFSAFAGLAPARLSAPWAFEGAIATAIVAAIAAFVPLPYAVRAVVASVAGAVPLAMGALQLGPLARLGDEGRWTALAMAAMATALPAALVFRARYRAFRAARVILGVALGLSVPAVILLVLCALDGAQSLSARGLAVVGIAGAAAATLGFMGPETSAGCTQWAAVVVGAYAARPTWRAISSAWSGREEDTVALTAAALGALVASTLVTFAVFQILAAALARHARKVDVHRAVGPGASDPGPRSNSGFED
jgi:hypothetical protein